MADRPTPEMLHTLLRYDSNTGMLWWRKRSVDLYADNKQNTARQQCQSWNTRYAGKEAFTALDGKGYFVGAIFDRLYKAHRVLWALATGEWPVAEIDHVNHDGTDNRMSNLRLVTNQENHQNMTLNSNNKSGFNGVHWEKARKKWRAAIKVDGKDKYLGRFTDLPAAIAARQAANIKYGYHGNHGIEL